MHLLRQNHATISMSRKGKPIPRCGCDSFLKTLKHLINIKMQSRENAIAMRLIDRPKPTWVDQKTSFATERS
jgi:hypothetical protein